MATVSFRGVTKRYDNGFEAVSDLDLEVGDGEFLVLVGPSGCGKTTSLRMLAGLERVTEGEIRIGDRVVNDVAPRDRDIAMVFQSYALYPHMTVGENISYPLRLAHVAKRERARRVHQVAKLLRLQDQLAKKPRQLSGGQRQRVAMGRAMVRKPQVFLMDEPLSNLDAKLRVQMRVDVSELQNRLGVTTVYVTHDQVEAMTMGDRVAILDRGRLLQVDHPQEVYRSPANLFVATFMGSPAMNLMLGTLRTADGDDGDRLELHVCRHVIPVTAALLAGRPALRRFVDRPVVIGIRPEQFRDPSTRSGAGRWATLSGTVAVVEPLGSEVLVHFSLPELEPFEVDVEQDGAETDEDSIEPMVRRFIARLDGDTSVRPGDTIELAVAADHVHWFDPQTGAAITAESSGPGAGPAAPPGELAGLVLGGGGQTPA